MATGFVSTSNSKNIISIGTINFDITLSGSNLSNGSKVSYVDIPNQYLGFHLLAPYPLGSFISGNAEITVADKTLSISGAQIRIDYWLHNPNSITTGSIQFRGSIFVFNY